jgi:outer membrane protein OmpA-like peptidoglycan-associated protein
MMTTRYLATRLKRPEGDVYATLLCSVSGNGEKRIQLIAVEEQSMENNMVDATQMAKGISADGHIALYNIYFDTDKADLKAESQPALEQIATMLKQDPNLTLLVVGHTDNVGKLDYNESLSQRRTLPLAVSACTPRSPAIAVKKDAA